MATTGRAGVAMTGDAGGRGVTVRDAIAVSWYEHSER